MEHSYVVTKPSKKYGNVQIRFSENGTFIQYEDPMIQDDYEHYLNKCWYEFLNN